MAIEEGQASTRLGADDLKAWVADVLVRLDVPRADAAIVARVLVDADLTGKHTHGVSRLPLYADRLARHLIEARPSVRMESAPTGGPVRLDGGNGLGPVVAWRAMELAVSGAQSHGLAAVSVAHSNHCGALYEYCAEAARAGMILMATTNSPPGMPPYGGRTAFLGTNPIAWGIPRASEAPPLVIDLATSVVARGNIIQAARLHEAIPLGWAIDSEGNPTQDAQKALAGSVLPMAGMKGYALALVMEVLSGVLSGAGIGPAVRNPYTDQSGPSNVGHFFLAIDPGRLMSESQFADRIRFLEEGIREVPGMNGVPVTVPGDRSELLRQQRLDAGIPLDRPLMVQLDALAVRLGISALSRRAMATPP